MQVTFNLYQYASSHGNVSDPRMYSLYPSAINSQWQLARSPPQQQQQQQQQQSQQQTVDQSRSYAGGQNAGTQQSSSASASNTSNSSGRSASTSGPPSAGTTGPSMTPQYAINGGVPPAFAYGTPGAWMSGPQQLSSPQNSIPPQVNAAYNIMFDPSQQAVPPQQAAYVHSNVYETAAYYSQPQQQQQQQQQSSSQQSLDTVQQGNYSR
jgi:hypothetical protein